LCILIFFVAHLKQMKLNPRGCIGSDYSSLITHHSPFTIHHSPHSFPQWFSVRFIQPLELLKPLEPLQPQTTQTSNVEPRTSNLYSHFGCTFSSIASFICI
jgi:hypothetical protein